MNCNFLLDYNVSIWWRHHAILLAHMHVMMEDYDYFQFKSHDMEMLPEQFGRIIYSWWDVSSFASTLSYM